MGVLHGSGNAERNAYGTACFCVGRRIYVLIFCTVLASVCLLQLGRLILSFSIVHSILGQETLPPRACSGLECYEVFSCRGFAWTTEDIRKLLLIAPGAVLFPLGIHAALHGYRLEMKLVSFYLMILSAAYVCCFIGDLVYYETCSAYSGNVIDQTLLLPLPFPLRRAAQDEISKMTVFPMADVDKITHDFGTMSMYAIIEVIVCWILLYSTYETMILAHLLERGPLGMGVHYGLGQFSEIINHEELQKLKMPRSKFIDDCKLPTYDDAEAPLAYHVHHNYGAFYGDSAQAAHVAAPHLKGGSKEQFEHAKEAVTQADQDKADALQAYNEAKFAQDHAQGTISDLEHQARHEAFDNEVHLEQRQGRRAEHLAQDAADEAFADAQAAGCADGEARMRMAMAYQQTLAKHHQSILAMAKVTALHSHFDHANREKDYREMDHEIVQAVEDTREELERAEARSRLAQEQLRTMGAAAPWEDEVDDEMHNMGEMRDVGGPPHSPVWTPTTPSFHGTADFGSAPAFLNPHAASLPAGTSPLPGASFVYGTYPGAVPFHGAAPTPSGLTLDNLRAS